MKIRHALLCSVAIGAALISAGPALAKTPVDQLVIAMNMTSMRGMDPQELNQFESAEVIANLYDRLLMPNPEDQTELLPGLAESWDISEDGKTFTFHIRDGVTFHSGNPLTAKDVEWSLRRLVNMGLAPARDLKQWGFTAENVESLIRATDDHTLVLETPTVWSTSLVLYSLASFSTSVVDSVFVQDHIENDDYGLAYLETHDAGSGPYSLRTWRANDTLIAEAYPDYWGGEPAMRRVILRNIPESSSQRLQLESDDIDIATRLSSTDLIAVGDQDDIHIESTPGVGFYYLALNQNDEILSNPKVREAFRYLIDYDGLAGTVMKYYGKMQQTIVPAGMPGAMDEDRYTLDIDMAKKLLAEGGYPDGFSKVYYASPATPEFEIAQSIQANAERAGLDLDLQIGDHIGDFRGRDYEIFSARTGERMPDPYAVLQSYAQNPDNSQEANLTGLMAWRAAWDVPAEIQDLVNQVAHEVDAAKREEMYRTINELYLEASPPLITSFRRLDPRAVRNEVEGYTGMTTWVTRWDSVTKSE